MSASPDQKKMEEHIREALDYRVKAPDSIGAMLDFELIDCNSEAGEATLSHLIHEREINIYGTLHGGIITWLMDSAMGIMARAYTGHDVLVTLDIHVHFLKAIHAGDKVIIKAHVTHAGRKVVNTTSELFVNNELSATADAIFYNVN